MPNAAALASEYVPLRRRPFAVTLTVVCIPLGGTLAGFTGAVILPAYGWRALFFVGGALPLVLAALLWKVLPESPRYLARDRSRWPELAALLRRLGHDVPPDAAFVDSHERAVARASVASLFAPEFRRDTLALCAAFFFCLLSAYIGVNWVPSLLTSAGFDVAMANYGLTAFNLGGVVGAIVGAIVVCPPRVARDDARHDRRRHRRMPAAGQRPGRGTVDSRPARHARVDRRTDQRGADDDVCAWRRTSIPRRFARPASARRSRSAGSAASARRTRARGRSNPARRRCSR